MLEDPLVGQVFLDNVHLNPRGHQLLAEVIAAELRQRGWNRAQVARQGTSTQIRP